MLYNFLCSILSLYSFCIVLRAYYRGGLLYTFAMKHDADVEHAFAVYVCTKHLELLDTVFMILRHKQRQITFLHVSESKVRQVRFLRKLWWHVAGQVNNKKLVSNELIWTKGNHKKIPMLVFRVLAIGHFTESIKQSIQF